MGGRVTLTVAEFFFMLLVYFVILFESIWISLAFNAGLFPLLNSVLTQHHIGCNGVYSQYNYCPP